jgi:transposase
MLDAVDRGLPRRREISNLFGVSLSTIKRYLKRRREGEDLQPRRSTGRKRRILATSEHKRPLWEQPKENDEATLGRHCELWEKEQGVKVSIATMSRAIRQKLGWTLKKDSGCHRTRPRGARWCLEKALERSRSSALCVRGRVLDQRVRMVPLRARAPRGKRAFGKAPKNWKNNVTLISSMNLGGMGASMSIEGSVDGEAFLVYVERLLRPTLERGQIAWLWTTSRCTTR